MAMAEVFIPERKTDDTFTAFPRAPPPSPELQPRGLKSIFEIPASKFEGALDLRMKDFDFTETSPIMSGEVAGFPLNGHSLLNTKLSGYNGRSPAIEEEESDWDSMHPGSPKKRPCSSPSVLPNSFEIHEFYRSGSMDSRSSSLYVHPGSVSSCDGIVSNLSESHSHSTNCHQSHSSSNSPQHFTSTQPQHSCPIPQRPGQLPSSLSGSATPTHASQLSPEHTLTNSHQQLSRSFDLHNVHPHLPLTFDTVQLPEVRPMRAHTLGATTYDDDANLRKRKVSLKRRKEDIDSDPSLQFSFEYSYSSTGSSGDSDWVVVEHEASSYPQGKKACCQDTPTSVAMSRHSIFPTSSNTSLDSPLFLRVDQSRTHIGALPEPLSNSTQSSSLAPIDNRFVQTTPYSLQSSHPPTLDSGFGSYMSSNLQHESVNTRLDDLEPQASVDSVTMMDCADYNTRLDSLDSMDCGQSEQQQQQQHQMLAADMVSPNNAHLYVNFQPTQQQQAFMFELGTTHIGTTLDVGRSHSSGAGFSTNPSTESGGAARHSFVENYFTAYHEQQSEGLGSMNSSSRFSFSKSL